MLRDADPNYFKGIYIVCGYTDHPREFLKDFSGTVVTDGYQVYRKLADDREDLKVAGCWIHARRPFADFIKSVGLKTAKGTVAQEAYDMITDILHTDNEFVNILVRRSRLSGEDEAMGPVVLSQQLYAAKGSLHE